MSAEEGGASKEEEEEDDDDCCFVSAAAVEAAASLSVFAMPRVKSGTEAERVREERALGSESSEESEC